MIYIFCALYHEAEPLIREYGLKKRQMKLVFLSFSEEENILLTVTGCGMNANDGGRGENLYEKNSTAGGFSGQYRYLRKVSCSKGSGQTCRNVSEKETAMEMVYILPTREKQYRNSQ